MLIPIIGNYQSNNLGDDQYLATLQLRYPEHKFIAGHTLGGLKPDFIIYGGGGVLRNKDSRVAKLSEWRKKYKVPFGVMSVGTAEGEILSYKKQPFEGAEFITVRDEMSALAIPKATLLPDLAWAWKPKTTSPLIPLSTGIMLRHSTRYNSFDLVCRARSVMADFPDEQFLFFSTYGERLGDRTLAHSTRAGFRSSWIPYTGLRPHEYLNHYRKCRRVLTMPLHGIIFAAIYGVEWASWSYSAKVTWQAEQIGGVVSHDLREPLIWNRTPRAVVERLRVEAEKHFQILDRYFG